MKNVLKLDRSFARIEFWGFTTIFAFVMFFFIADAFYNTNVIQKTGFQSAFEKAGMPFDFYRNYFIPQLVRNVFLFLVLLYLNFILVPKLINRQSMALHILLLFLLFAVSVFVFAVTDFYLRAFTYSPDDGLSLSNEQMMREGLDNAVIMFSVFAIYSIIKYVSLYLLSVSAKLESKHRFIRREGIVATFIWLIILLLLVTADAPELAIAGWLIAIPSAILLYLFGFLHPDTFIVKQKISIFYLCFKKCFDPFHRSDGMGSHIKTCCR